MVQDLIIRDCVPSEMPFIYDSWLSSYQHTSYFARKIKKDTFMKCHAILLNILMSRSDIVIKIASDEDFLIYGYIVAESIDHHPVIHYCYVRPEYQQLGIGTTLYKTFNLRGMTEVSHWTPIINLIQHKKGMWDYNPYRI